MSFAFRIAALAGALALCASAAQASVSYLVNVDTSSIAGADGFLEFQFSDPGPIDTVEVALASITGFQSVGGSFNQTDPYSETDPYGTPNVFGHVDGTLPGTLRLHDIPDVALSDYLQGFHFGSSFSFVLTLSGPAIDAPVCAGCYRTQFSLNLWNADITAPLLVDPTDGQFILGQVAMNPDGGFDLTTNAGPDGALSALSITAVPEPMSWALMIVGFGGVGCVLRRRSVFAAS